MAHYGGPFELTPGSSAAAEDIRIAPTKKKKENDNRNTNDFCYLSWPKAFHVVTSYMKYALVMSCPRGVDLVYL